MKKSLSKKTQQLLSNNNLLKIGQAAKTLGVHIDTLRRWEKAGKITAIKTSGGTRLYSLDELNRIQPNTITPDQTKSLSTQDLIQNIEVPSIPHSSSLLTKLLIGTAGTLAVTGAIVARSVFFAPHSPSHTTNYQLPT